MKVTVQVELCDDGNSCCKKKKKKMQIKQHFSSQQTKMYTHTFLSMLCVFNAVSILQRVMSKLIQL